MSEVLGADAPSQATVAEFRRGRQSTEDEHLSGGPLEASTKENVDFVQDMVLADRSDDLTYCRDIEDINWHSSAHYVRRLGI